MEKDQAKFINPVKHRSDLLGYRPKASMIKVVVDVMTKPQIEDSLEKDMKYILYDENSRF